MAYDILFMLLLSVAVLIHMAIEHQRDRERQRFDRQRREYGR